VKDNSKKDLKIAEDLNLFVLNMDVKKLNGGGSRAAKKRRKENNTTTEIVNDKIEIKGDEKESASLKPDKKLNILLIALVKLL
jgi:hypothetical protein